MRRGLLIAIFIVLLFVDMTAVSQTLALLGLAALFGAVGHGAGWLPIVLLSVVVTAGLIWVTIVTWRAITASNRGQATTTG